MTRTLVFIDGLVAGSSSILSGLRAGAEWFFIDPAEDDITRMEAVLVKHGDLASVQIASHRATGVRYREHSICAPPYKYASHKSFGLKSDDLLDPPLRHS